jgi:hypothetical protein
MHASVLYTLYCYEVLVECSVCACILNVLQRYAVLNEQLWCKCVSSVVAMIQNTVLKLIHALLLLIVAMLLLVCTTLHMHSTMPNISVLRALLLFYMCTYRWLLFCWQMHSQHHY